jgi:hypothetical protein
MILIPAFLLIKFDTYKIFKNLTYTLLKLFMKKLTAIIFLFIMVSNCSESDVETFEFTLEGTGLEDVPVYKDITVTDLPDVFCLEMNDRLLPAQAEPISESETRVWWLATQDADETAEYLIRREEQCTETEYSWTRTGDESLQLLNNGRPLLQYEHPVFDYDNIEGTKKPFHHVFDPLSGEIITKGPGGLYSHHRGIYFGYNRVEFNDTVMDIWHARNGERSEHVNIISEYTGPVFGGHLVQIDWKDHDGETILEEFRDIRAMMHSEESYFIDFNSSLFARSGPVYLGGDLHHAGVQFRAAQYVADHSESTRFVRPEDWSEYPGDYELGEEERINLPWNAMQFTIEDDTYTVVYMSHPSNPGEEREMSERLYGRFGEFFPYELDEGEAVNFRYRFWVIAGVAPPVNEIRQMYERYAE